MAKKTAFTYAPSRGKGILFLAPVCVVLTALEIYLVRNFGGTKIGLQFFLLLIAMIIAAVPRGFCCTVCTA